MMKIAAVASGWAPDALMVAGAGSVSYGAGMIYPAAAWLVGGAFAIYAGWMLSKAAQ